MRSRYEKKKLGRFDSGNVKVGAVFTEESKNPLYAASRILYPFSSIKGNTDIAIVRSSGLSFNGANSWLEDVSDNFEHISDATHEDGSEILKVSFETINPDTLFSEFEDFRKELINEM